MIHVSRWSVVPHLPVTFLGVGIDEDGEWRLLIFLELRASDAAAPRRDVSRGLSVRLRAAAGGARGRRSAASILAMAAGARRVAIARDKLPAYDRAELNARSIPTHVQRTS